MRSCDYQKSLTVPRWHTNQIESKDLTIGSSTTKLLSPDLDSAYAEFTEGQAFELALFYCISISTSSHISFMSITPTIRRSPATHSVSRFIGAEDKIMLAKVNVNDYLNFCIVRFIDIKLW
jgi:hypothetical protein